ncbi:MAG: hypothetical protein ABIR68_18610 [Ilumatobacteraceae bacterium]
MMIKRSLQFAAPLVLVLALGACGSDSKSDSTTGPTVTTTATASSTVVGGTENTTSTAGTVGSPDTAGTSGTDVTPGTGGTRDTVAGGGSTVTGNSTDASTVTGNSTAPGAGTEFCAINADIDDALKSAADADAGLIALKQIEPKFDDYLAKAPADQKDSVTAFVESSRKAIAADDANILANDEAAVLAVTTTAAYCGYDI